MEKDESKKDKFNRIISGRLQNFKLSCDKLAKCGNQKYFDYTEEEKKKVLKYIDNEIDMLKKKFNHSPFKFKENGEI